MIDERKRWNQRYQAADLNTQPADAFLCWAYETFIAPIYSIPGRALDLAGGRGRHALWLAHRGWQTTLVDISDVAIQKSDAALDKLITLKNQDVAQFLGTKPQFDLVIIFYFLDRAVFPAIERAVRPGGFLLYKTFTTEQRQFTTGPNSPDHLLKPGELRAAFPTLQLLHYSEIVAQTATAELVARRNPG